MFAYSAYCIFSPLTNDTLYRKGEKTLDLQKYRKELAPVYLFMALLAPIVCNGAFLIINIMWKVSLEQEPVHNQTTFITFLLLKELGVATLLNLVSLQAFHIYRIGTNKKINLKKVYVRLEAITIFLLIVAALILFL